MVAHWTPRKRILDALEALSQTSDSVALDLVGATDRDSSYAARVRRMLATPELAGRVEVHGQVTSERLGELYAAADALLLCSSHEGYGMVLAEALAAGLPIVATRVGAVPEVVRDGFDAALVEAGDIAGLARALERLARDPAERERRAALAREHAASLPTWEDSTVAFEHLLVRLMSDA
jgi:glycosyltransferase involved in cell wall biosynthesis